jgi:hypothetical protein
MNSSVSPASIAILIFAALASFAAGQNAHPGPVTGVIDAVRFEGDQFYVFGWACQEGNRGSIDVHIYANHASGDKPPGTFVTADTANLDNEPAVDRECHDANGGKHRFKIALTNQLMRTSLWNQGSASWGPKGVYFTTSPDFIHWSKPQLAMTQDQMLKRETEGSWSYQYFSLIDPNSTDSSYMTITDTPYLYYVRMDDFHGPYQRVLFRQKIKLDWLTKSLRSTASTP